VVLSQSAVDSVPLHSVPPAALASLSGTVEVNVAPLRLPISVESADWFAWAPGGQALTILGQNTLYQVRIQTGARMTLLTLPQDAEGYIGPFAWMPDNKTLLFAFGPRQLSPGWYRYDAPARPPPVHGAPATDAASFDIPQVCMCPLPPGAVYALMAA
jgi:hypothetical protein